MSKQGLNFIFVEGETLVENDVKLPNKCPVCNSKQFKRLYSQVIKEGFMIVARCLKCPYELGVEL